MSSSAPARRRKWTPATLLAAAVAIAGCGEDSSPTDPADTAAPSVTLAASASAVTERQTLTLDATASDDVGVASVTFLRGGTTLGTSTSAPHSFSLDLEAADNGELSFTAVARDAAGNQATSAAALVDVAIPSLPFADAFGDGQVDSTQWTMGERSASLAETGGRLEVTIPPVLSDTDPSAGISTVCLLTGDFDASVEYELVNWPAQSGVRVGLTSLSGGAERVGRGAGEGGDEVYASDHRSSGGALTFSATMDTAGRLRMTRVGNVLTSYSWDGADWVEMQASVVSSIVDTRLGLAAWTHQNLHGGQEAVVAFDNFQIAVGTAADC